MNKIRLDIRTIASPFVHIVFCLIILFAPLLMMSLNGITEYKYFLGYAIRTSLLILIFYINYFFLIDKFFFQRQFVVFVISNIILIVATSLLQNLLFQLLLTLGPPPPLFKVTTIDGKEVPRPPHELRILGDYVLTVLAVGMSVALKVTKQWYKDSINLESVKAHQLEADLRNLRNQLNPHFLFNTLNNIYSLIAIDSNLAQESVYRLSNLLRYVLYENENRFVALNKEIEFTQNYIDLMRLRLNKNVKLDVVINYEECDKSIASLLFITLIENAFKHGISNGLASYINIKILVNSKGVLCTVENSMDKSNTNGKSINSGVGLANLRKRLNLLYPNKYQLKIEEKENDYFALLYIGF